VISYTYIHNWSLKTVQQDIQMSLNCRLPSEHEVQKITVIGIPYGSHEHELFSP
jgi:hypothetical protein